MPSKNKQAPGVSEASAGSQRRTVVPELDKVIELEDTTENQKNATWMYEQIMKDPAKQKRAKMAVTSAPLMWNRAEVADKELARLLLQLRTSSPRRVWTSKLKTKKLVTFDGKVAFKLLVRSCAESLFAARSVPRGS